MSSSEWVKEIERIGVSVGVYVCMYVCVWRGREGRE